MEKIYNQHGDLLLVEVNKIPETAKKVKITSKIVTLLKGEGVNTHDIKLKDFNEVEIYQDGETLYVKTKENSINLGHKEHGSQVIFPNKIFKRRIEREFDYETEEARQTRD